MLTSMDLFAGAGGLSEGFRQAGFNILAANDFDRFSAETFRTVHPETAFLEGPIQKLSPSDFLKRLELKKGNSHALPVAHHARHLAFITISEACTMKEAAYSVNIFVLLREYTLIGLSWKTLPGYLQ